MGVCRDSQYPTVPAQVENALDLPVQPPGQQVLKEEDPGQLPRVVVSQVKPPVEPFLSAQMTFADCTRATRQSRVNAIAKRPEGLKGGNRAVYVYIDATARARMCVYIYVSCIYRISVRAN